MKITNSNQVDFSGLVLVFSTTVIDLSKAGKLHDYRCSVAVKAMNNPKAHAMCDSGIDYHTQDLLDRGYGVSLCKCAKHAKK